MKKVICSAISLAVFTLFAGKVVDISTFKDQTKLIGSGPVFVENFDNGAARWKLGEGFSVVKSQGVNGSPALLYERIDPKNNKTSIVRLKNLNPGLMYRLSVTYRTELKVDPTRKIMEIFAVTFMKGNKRISGAFMMKGYMNTPDWSEMAMTFTIPEGTEYCNLALLMRTLRSGKIWYDNIRIDIVGNAAEQFHLVKPYMLKLNKKKEVAFQFLLSSESKKKNLLLIVDANGKKFQFPVKSSTVTGTLDGVNDKEVKLVATLVDLNKKEIINRQNFTVFSSDNAVPPSGAVTYRKDGAVQVDGKPFLPIGIFLGFLDLEKDPDALKRIKEAGFNTVQSIGTMPRHFFFAGVKKTKKESMLASLDLLHRMGLKYVFAIKYQLPSQQHLTASMKEFDHVKGLENVNHYIVNSVKNHPAMLGWYVSDENPVDQLPEILKLRQTISRLDPWHPILTLTDKPNDMFSFAATGDTLLVDPYPIGMKISEIDKPQNMQWVRTHLDSAVTGGTPVWLVPQIFGWSSFSPRKHRYPTAEEIRSMVLQGTIRGVKGYLFYAYHPIFYYSEKIDPGKSQMQWNNVVPTAKLLNELTPFILSEEKAPAVTVKQLSGKKIEARAFRHNGKVCVVITAVGPGKASAEITVPGVSNLSSRFGKTKNLGNGKYLFEATDVSSDVLK